MTEKRTWVGPNAPERLNILRNTRTIAIVGMSDKISRASNFVATYLLSSSPYTVYFVNPILAAKGKTVLGQPVYASLQDLPEVPDLVEISAAMKTSRVWFRRRLIWARRPCGCSWARGMRKLPLSVRQLG